MFYSFLHNGVSEILRLTLDLRFNYYSDTRIECYDKLISKIRILEYSFKKSGFPDLT